MPRRSNKQAYDVVGARRHSLVQAVNRVVEDDRPAVARQAADVAIAARKYAELRMPCRPFAADAAFGFDFERGTRRENFVLRQRWWCQNQEQI